ncbi:MAG: dihydrodipicolinate synthase family protein, partial [Phycisphaerae bacterium]
ISVLGNLCPSLMKTLAEAATGGSVAAALRVHKRVYDLAVSLARFGPNPLPIKTAMAALGLLEPEFRLPLCPPSPEARAGITEVLRRHKLLERVPA